MSNIKNLTKENQQVLLVSLPWTNIIEPCLGLALLKSILQQNGYKAKVLHLNLFTLEFLKATTYEAISVVYALNDFLFSSVIDPEITPSQIRYLRVKATDLYQTGAINPEEVNGIDDIMEKLIELRKDIIPKWLDKWATEIASSNAKLIGFTCMFDQTIASAALSKLIRQKDPSKMIAFGGYAVRNPTCNMIMGSFPWIDAICYGEGEQTILELAKVSLGEMELSSVKGIVYRKPEGTIVTTPVPDKADLNQNPIPDYDDFFEDIKRLSKELSIDLKPASIPLENSRGCWWGAKHHCVFCGIHDDDLAYRHKTAEKVLGTLRELRDKYGYNSFRFSDYILPNSFYKTLLPELANENPKFVLSCEMKANVTEDQFKLLAAAGFHEVQPGIESFNSNVLHKMDKGVTAIQNVFTLKLGKKYGVRILYNILYGFPNDELEEYKQISELIPKINHFDPPVSCVPVQVTRYAPLQTNPQRFGISEAMHGPTYQLIFSKSFIESSGFDYDDFCYYYERVWDNSLYLQQEYDKIYHIVKEWGIPKNGLISRLYCDKVIPGKGMVICDSRFGEDQSLNLDVLAQETLSLSDKLINFEALTESLSEKFTFNNICDTLDELIAKNLVIREKEKLLSLVLPDKPISDGNHRYGYAPIPEAMNV